MGWRSGQDYSQDLRDRVLAAVDGGLGVYQAAPLFRVSVSYIYKALDRRRRTGETTTKVRRGQPGWKLEPHREALLAKVAASPDATIEELRQWARTEAGVPISVGAMWATLRRLGLRLKKSRGTRPSRNGRMLPKPARDGATASPL